MNKIEKFDLKTFNPLNDNLVLEASAGTGKTYSVTEIVNKIVYSSDEPKEALRKILIVTYTEKATGELKDRIKARLEEKGNITFNINDFNIYTIHSFCQNSLKEFGIEANLPLGLNVIDEKLYLEDFVDDYIRKNIPLSELQLFDKDKINIDSIKELLISSINNYYLDFNNKNVNDIVSIEKKEAYSKVLDAEDFEDFRLLFDEFNESYEYCLNSTNEKLNELAQDLKDNYKNCRLSKFGRRIRVTKNYTDEDKNVYDDLKNFVNEINEDFFMKNCFVSKYIDDLYIKWQEEKIKNKEQAFSDMIRSVRETILTNAVFKNALKKKYQYAIIDEFQDTNQLQFDIFKSIFLEDNNHHIIVVGDPKQSIYSFQGADLGVYEKAKKEIVSKGGLLKELDTNWRSSEDMIKACNSFFKNQFFKDIDFRDSLYSGCDKKMLYKGNPINALQIGAIETENDFEPLSSNDYAKAIIERIIDYCFKDKNGKTNLQIKPKNYKDDKDNLVIPPYRNVKFSDFAIIYRTRSEVAPIERLLKRYGIPYVKFKDNTLFKGKECAHWIAVLEAINSIDFTGNNRNKFKRALFTDFFGRSFYEINDSYFNKDDSWEMELINKWKIIAKEKNWELLIDSILEDSSILERLNSLDKLQSISYFKQIGDYAISYLYDNHNLEELIDNLTNLSNGEASDDEDSSTVNVGTDFDSIKIISMHSSKGLQYPIVISVGGFKGKNIKSKTFLYHDKSNKKHLCFNASNEVKTDMEAEWIRLIYVAYTRSEYMLMIPYYAPSKNEDVYIDTLRGRTKAFLDNKNNIFSSFIDEGLSSFEIKNKINSILNSISKEDELEKMNSQKRAIKELIKSGNDKKSFKHAYSSLSHPKDNKEALDIDDPDLINKEGEETFDISDYDKINIPLINNLDNNKLPLIIPNKFPKGADIGSALHEVFELSTFTDYSLNCYDKNIHKLELIIDNALKHYKINLNEYGINYIKDIVKNVLNADLTLINGNELLNKKIKLSEIDDSNKKAEMEFNFNLMNQKFKNYCNGFIDLVFRQGDYFSILDWKSDGLNEDDLFSYSDFDSLKNHTDNHYSIQRVLYSYCLIKWLNSIYKEKDLEETFNKHFGGVYYVYLRGCNIDSGNGIYCQTWKSFNDLKKAFDFIIKDRIGGDFND